MSIPLLLVGCGGSNPPASSGSPTQEITESQARALYIRKCSLCHGADGKLMASKSPDLSLSALSLEKRVALVTYGKGTMPGQKGVLSAPEIQAVARYIERFRE
jgi:cytochrome c6